MVEQNIKNPQQIYYNKLKKQPQTTMETDAYKETSTVKVVPLKKSTDDEEKQKSDRKDNLQEPAVTKAQVTDNDNKEQVL